jgi:hypothetical protein
MWGSQRVHTCATLLGVQQHVFDPYQSSSTVPAPGGMNPQCLAKPTTHNTSSC